MIEQMKEDSERKNKKKKHHRSRSRSQHKKHKRSRSRSQHKKDKKRKQKSSRDHHIHSPTNEKRPSLHEHDSKLGFKQPEMFDKNQSYKSMNEEETYKDKNVSKIQSYDDQRYDKMDHRKTRDQGENKIRDSYYEKDHKEKDDKQRQRKERDYKEKDRKQKDYKQRDYKEKDYKERDFKQRDFKDRDFKDRDLKDRDFKDRERQKSHKDKSHKEKQTVQRQSKAFTSNFKDDIKQVEKNDRQNRDKKNPTQTRQKHNRSREHSYQKDKRRQTSKYDRQDRQDKYQSRRRQRQSFRSRSHQKKQRSPVRYDRQGTRRRSRSKDNENRNDRWRNQKRRDNGRFDPGQNFYFMRRRFRFDSPPKSDESDMSDDPEKMQKLNRMKAEKQLVTSKADRKLYLGNLPPNITSQQLMDMLNAALKKMQINTDCEGDSIISAWISPDGVGHYAFVEFRTAQQATNGLALNGASLFGYQLKLGRPKQYIEYNKQLLSKFGSDSSIDTIIKKVQAMGGELSVEVSQKIICPPTRIIVLKHIVTVEELAIDEEYQQIYDDVLDMAKRFGDVIKVVIPRPHEVFDLEEVRTRVKGLGYIFVEYKTVEQAIFARKQLVQKQFSSRSVACSFFNEKRFRQTEYDILEKVIIDF